MILGGGGGGKKEFTSISRKPIASCDFLKGVDWEGSSPLLPPSGSAHVSDILPTMYMNVTEGITKMVISYVTALTVLTAVSFYKCSWCEIIYEVL